MPEKDKYYEEYQQALHRKSDIYKDKTIEESLNDEAELYYYSQRLNRELRKKDPENFDKLIKEYGYNKERPLDSTTRIEGAKYYVSGTGGRKFDKSLTIEEQKDILGKDWDRYAELKQNYGSELELFGENEKSDKPETWKVGARHAVAMNPITYEHVYKEGSNIKSNYLREVKYDPSQINPYVATDVSLPLNKSTASAKPTNQYTRTLAKLGMEINNKGYEDTESGRVWTQKGAKRYYKYFNDGSKQEIPQTEYEKWIGFNQAPATVKQKYGTETVDLNTLSPNDKEKAQALLDASNQ